jgi:hypothetical protein
LNLACVAVTAVSLIGVEDETSFADTPRATNLTAFYREGQSFVTWREDDSVHDEWYRIYSSTKPITESNLADATYIARIPEGSREYRFLKDAPNRLKTLLDSYDWSRGIQLEDDDHAGKILPQGTGVFVRTIKQAARSYYAITIETDGKENVEIEPGKNSLLKPIRESVEPPGAIRLQKYADRFFAYLFFTDFETWNPDKTDDNWEGYAHVLHVRVPDSADSNGRRPLTVRLHAYTAWKDWWIPYCYPNREGIDLRLLDYHLTWWYGYNDALPQSEGGKYERYPVPGRVVNFTEQRVLQAVSWLKKDPPNFPARIDPMQICVLGGSMGGSGANVFGLRHGDIFAGSWGSKGITNWALPPEHNNWYSNIRQKIGPLERNDMTNEGSPVYDLLNMPKWLGDHPEIDTPFHDAAHGLLDTVITFHSVPDYWSGLERGKHPYSAGWDMVGHASALSSGSPMDFKLMRSDESTPALSNASCNTPMRSGYRLIGESHRVTERTLSVEEPLFNRDLTGMTLVLGPSERTRTWFRIKGNTSKTLTVEQGNLAAYIPPSSNWWQRVLKQRLKREPTDDESREEALKRKSVFLVCDGEPRGTRNGHFAWSSRNQGFDANRTGDDIVDHVDKWAISLRLHDNRFSDFSEETATVDVTPRRCQHFRPRPGEDVHWVNLDHSDPDEPVKIAEGHIKTDQYGLVTVPQFTVGRKGWGNRLVLTRGSR